ncbi:phage holin family protein [Amycolatopsis benzoatilytica]|uniref:phage holin family protein n=1 Tax=Amycolatopsis benzoatilytica TaxID=346045 RepID=UPI0003A5F752|nr:phage holin family protein [Amycolatopsis benzoatilytica]
MLEEMNRTPAREKSTAELAADLSVEVRHLINDEFRLAQAELRGKAKRLGIGAGMAGAAATAAFFGGGVLVAAAVLGLALVLPAWLAALLIGAALLLAAGVAALLGKKQAQRAVPPLPEEAVEGVREDIDVVKREVRS